MHRTYENETNRSIAKRLVYKVMEQAERDCVNVTATCSYARKVIEE